MLSITLSCGARTFLPYGALGQAHNTAPAITRPSSGMSIISDLPAKRSRGRVQDGIFRGDASLRYVKMTIQQLEQRLVDLERQVAELRTQSRPLQPYSSVSDTFGVFANDPDFDDVVRFGREYRAQANTENGEC